MTLLKTIKKKKINKIQRKKNTPFEVLRTFNNNLENLQ